MVNNLGPFANYDIFQNTVRFLEPKDIGRLGIVCKQYDKWLNKASIWIQVSEKEGIPLVAGNERNRRNDFRILYPITISGRMIGELFGKVIGRVPPISEYWFDKFAKNMADPYETTKLFKDNFVVLVDPSLIERAVDKETPLDIDESGNLKEVAPDAVLEQTLTIPFSLRNLHLLSKYPLKGKEHLPVFGNDSEGEFFELSTSYPKQIGVRIMRRSILNESRYKDFDRRKDFDEKDALVEQLAPGQGFEVESLRRRSLFNAILILNTGASPEGGDDLPDYLGRPVLQTYVRDSNTITLKDGLVKRFVAGLFFPGQGIYVKRQDSCLCCFMGVVPGGSGEFSCPSEIQSLELKLEQLTIDEGHGLMYLFKKAQEWCYSLSTLND